MSRYIDADELKSLFILNFEKLSDLVENKKIIDISTLIGLTIDKSPTADVKPIVRGKWVDVKDDITHTYSECSICSHTTNDYIIEKSNDGFYTALPKFCGKCGADMRGNEDD